MHRAVYQPHFPVRDSCLTGSEPVSGDSILHCLTPQKINQYSLIVPAAHTVVEPPAVMVEVRHTLVTGATMFRLRSPETTTYIYLCLQQSAA